jgi:hypothetical protein
MTCALQNMRMVCNSAYLLEDPSAKAVVFSQWKGTHELIQRRLASHPQGKT